MFADCRRSPERALQGLSNDVSEPVQAAIDALPDEAKAIGWFIEAGCQGGRGPTHDYRALGDWAFPLGDVTAPVELWQGDADVLVPMAHAEDLAAVVPGATLRRCPGEGHLLMATHATELLATAAGQRH
jgi:pimeloyl-ACP methyl ester carboxylesterase